MRVAVITDVHSNLPALEATLDACAPYDTLWVLGDVVGYGPYPDEVVARLRREHAVAVRGNHDAAVLGELDTHVFNDDARLAVEWTAERLGTTARHWLSGLPERRVEEGFTLVHGSPRDPLWEYLVSVSLARRNLAHLETTHALVGHTHVPLVFREEGTRIETIHPREGTRLALDERRCLINPGGVGQPRDGDPRACAMILDTERSEVEWLRVPYPIEKIQARMRRQGLPGRLADRLAYGL
jgi:diadenosine tetraphosphatase ApaH/serine/threonine PP2A family protein phosphatase